MKNRKLHPRTANFCVLMLLGFWFLMHEPSTVLGQGTAFTYQGRLNEGGNPANGSYVFRFSLDDGNGTPIGNPIGTPPLNVSNGLFTVTLDFGVGIFTGDQRRLFIAVHTNDNSSDFVPLTPPQPILPAPYAIFAEGASGAGITGVLPAGALSGSYSNVLNLTNTANILAGDGGGLANVNAAKLGGLGAANFWQTTGNAGTAAGTHFLGTTDDQPFELRANGQRAMRFEGGSSVPNVIGGHVANAVGAGLSGVTIAGGGDPLSFNQVNANWGSVGGGSGNSIGTGAGSSTIAGGGDNTVDNSASYSTIGGGFENYAAATHAVLGGGYVNFIGSPANFSVIGGGSFNLISTDANSMLGTIAGGERNTIGSDRLIFEMTPGGNAIGGGVANAIREQVRQATISGGGNDDIAMGANYAVIGGGFFNGISSNSVSATVAGGERNAIDVGASYSTIGGGISNLVSGVAATVAGGEQNSALGAGSFAAGTRAIAAYDGSFAMSDRQPGPFSATAPNQFAIRAQSGVMIQSTITALDLRGNGAIRVASAGVGTGGPVFIHRATAANTSGHITTIDHPLCNGDPNAILLITHNYSADNSSTRYEPNTVGVWYDGSRWTIYHENTTVAMPVGRAFNVMVIKP